MAAIPDIFPAMLVNMVQAGESSGKPGYVILTEWQSHFEKEAKLKATIRKATIYPIILICAVIGVIAVMLLVCYSDLYRYVCRSGCGDAGADDGCYECQQMDGRPLVCDPCW